MEKALYFSIVKGISPCFWTRSPIFSFCTGTHRLRSQTRFQVCPNYCSSSQPLRGLQGLEWWLLHSLPTCCPHIRQPWTCTKIRIFKAGHEVKGLGKLILASFTGTLMDLTVHKILKKNPSLPLENTLSPCTCYVSSAWNVPCPLGTASLSSLHSQPVCSLCRGLSPKVSHPLFSSFTDLD